MLAQLLQADPKGGHPVWHFGAVAVAAVSVFLAIKAFEWWGHRRSEDDQSWIRRPLARPSGPTIALALSSLGSSAIHAAVCPSHFREATAFGVFFVVVAAAPAGLAIAIIVRPSRKLLVAGALGNAGVVALWVLTRTVGLPLGPEIWRPEAINGGCGGRETRSRSRPRGVLAHSRGQPALCRLPCLTDPSRPVVP